MRAVNPLTHKPNLKKICRSLIAYGLQEGYSVAMWRLPSHAKINLLLSFQTSQVTDLVLEECIGGFVMAPFDRDKPKLLFEAGHLFNIENDEITEITPGQLIEKASAAGEVKDLKFHKGESSVSAAGGDGFIELAKESINAIEAGAFEKIVPSMRKQIEVKNDFDLLQAFDELSKRYPAAMVSLASDPKAGTWVGASPELLVSTDKHGIFKTVALAGTQAYREDVPLRSISWTQKEIEEQALVERYIISCFKKIRVREYDEHGPKTVQAGNVIHLKSDFEVNMKEVNYPQLGSVMLKLLHPTSAVCGMPLDASFKFLQENETHDREFYAGFLGPVNIDSECHLFVNLRCLKWGGDHLFLYAGAGVTIDSEPEQELKEVEVKMETIRKALGI
jgi:isochorismate synthase